MSNGILIDCRGSMVRIGAITKRVPKNHDCVITGFHVINGKIVKRGTIKFVLKTEPGQTNFIFSGNTIE
jgi:hypothetical protein